MRVAISLGMVQSSKRQVTRYDMGIAAWSHEDKDICPLEKMHHSSFPPYAPSIGSVLSTERLRNVW